MNAGDSERERERERRDKSSVTDERPDGSLYFIPSHLPHHYVDSAAAWTRRRPITVCNRHGYLHWLKHLTTIVRKTIRSATTVLKVKWLCALVGGAVWFVKTFWQLVPSRSVATRRWIGSVTAWWLSAVEFTATTNKITRVCRLRAASVTAR